MMTTKLSKKGQIVIPSELRERYNIKPGDKIELMDIGREIVIIPIAVKSPIDEAKGMLRGGRTTKDILKMIRNEEKALEKKKR